MGADGIGRCMIDYLESLPNHTKLSSDICIVGTGPAGISLAKELIDSGLSVIVLESGDFDYDGKTQKLYSGQVLENLPPEPLDVSRLRFFGGTSNHWGGSCGPFDPIDFNPRAWITDSGWPLTRDDLHGYYERAHSLIGLGPYDYRVSSWINEDWDLIDMSGTDVKNIVRQTNPQRFGQEYQTDLENADNIQVILHANLTSIQTNEALNHVTAVEATTLGGESITVEARKIVLACSGVGNARLLLAFGFGKKLPALGRYFSFHPRMRTGELLLSNPIDRSRFPYRWHYVNGTRMKFQFSLPNQIQEREKLPNHAAIISEMMLPNTMGYNAGKRLYNRLRGKIRWDGVTDDLYDVLMDIDGAYSQWSRRHNEHKISQLAVATYMDQPPNPDSRVLLAQEKDALGIPQAKIDWAHFEYEPAAVQRFNEILASSFGAAGVGRMKIVDDIEDSQHFKVLARELGGGSHQIGTTRMSQDVSRGVVDENCLVHGLDNLFCAGSSVFCTTSWVNPTTTIVALAVRLADHLRAQSRQAS